MKFIAAILVLFLLSPCLPSLAAEPSLTALLDFELGSENGWPAGWKGGPVETIHADSLTVHGGKWAARIARDSNSTNAFTSLTHSVSDEKKGKFITLIGYLKTEDVEGLAGLWLRLDGEAGNVGFDNMSRRKLDGTNDWAEYTIVLPYSTETRQVVFGALLSGQGTVWVDDLRLLVDGQPFDEAPALEHEMTVLDTDTEFATGSGVSLTDFSDTQVANLALLGKVWGFLKYHHPAITTGQRHWDFDLFRVLPRVLEAADRREAIGALLGWIDGLGEVLPCAPCAEMVADPAARPRLAWLDEEELLGRALGRRLKQVHANRLATGKQFFVSQILGLGNPVFTHENAYLDQGLPDVGYRLLALFRYWNIIEYWFPNRDLIDGDWDEVLASFVPQVAAADNFESYQLVMLRLIAEVRDGHANLYSADRLRPPVGENSLPVVIRFIEGQAVVTGFTNTITGVSTGLQPGDVIRKIDGVAVAELVSQWEPFYPASNRVFRLSTMARNLTRGPLGEVVLEIERNGEVSTLKAERMAISQIDRMAGLKHDLPGETFQRLGDDVAYLKLSSVENTQTANYLERAAGTRGLVVDIRNYPSSFMVFTLGGRLVTQSTPFVCFTRGDLNNPGCFLWLPTLALSPIAPRYEGKVVVLVDEATMSQAEYTAMALRAAPGTVIVGSTTAGADGNISTISLPGGLATNISGLGVFYPDHSPTQRVGIVPDLEVRPTLQGIRQGRDEVLEAAIRQIVGPDVSDEEIRAWYP